MNNALLRSINIVFDTVMQIGFLQTDHGSFSSLCWWLPYWFWRISFFHTYNKLGIGS